MWSEVVERRKVENEMYTRFHRSRFALPTDKESDGIVSFRIFSIILSVLLCDNIQKKY